MPIGSHRHCAQHDEGPFGARHLERNERFVRAESKGVTGKASISAEHASTSSCQEDDRTALSMTKGRLALVTLSAASVLCERSRKVLREFNDEAFVGLHPQML
jgi:hypothetical protein